MQVHEPSTKETDKNVLSSYQNPMRVKQYSTKKMYTLQTKEPI